MSNPTDTNQASEKELDTFMEQLGFFWDSYQSDWRNNGRKQFSRDYDDSISMDLAEQLLAHIRTEKLKLLAAVRERVVGTKDLKLSDIYGNDWRNNYGYTEVQVRDAANHLQRKQLNSLTKLEAEL